MQRKTTCTEATPSPQRAFPSFACGGPYDCPNSVDPYKDSYRHWHFWGSPHKGIFLHWHVGAPGSPGIGRSTEGIRQELAFLGLLSHLQPWTSCVEARTAPGRDAPRQPCGGPCDRPRQRETSRTQARVSQRRDFPRLTCGGPYERPGSIEPCKESCGHWHFRGTRLFALLMAVRRPSAVHRRAPWWRRAGWGRRAVDNGRSLSMHPAAMVERASARAACCGSSLHAWRRERRERMGGLWDGAVALDAEPASAQRSAFRGGA